GPLSTRFSHRPWLSLSLMAASSTRAMIQCFIDPAPCFADLTGAIGSEARQRFVDLRHRLFLEPVVPERFNGSRGRGHREGIDMARRTAPARSAPAAPARTRPFYLIGHNTNDMDQIRRGLEEGLNAFELDINKDHHGQLYVAHDPVNPVQTGRYYEQPLTTEKFFTELKALFQTEQG